MGERPDNSRAFLTEFIELYKSLPCLWHIQSNQYRDKVKKNKAYGLLVQKYKEIDPAATKQTVKSKINALRTTYRKVLGRLNQSIQSGATGAEVYRPSLWYFHMFDFLRDLEPLGVERFAHDDDSASKREQYDEDTQESDEKYYSSDPFAHASPSPSMLGPEQHFISSTSQRLRLSRKRRSTLQFNGARDGIIEIPPQEDPFELFGRHIANKLRSLAANQNVFAQKLINDVLFEAEMDSLSRGCKIITEAQT